ncbi:hypothetical protein TNCV_133511 [Trichonephila clavipes]|nr:hypothetical protein TNCV_133511 [Trichonephila clavipes]
MKVLQLKNTNKQESFNDTFPPRSFRSDFTGCVPHPSIHVKFYGSEQVAKRPVHVTVGSLFIVWPRNRVDTRTGSHNAHRVTRDEACLANDSDTLEIYERIVLGNKGGVMNKKDRCWTSRVAPLHSPRAMEPRESHGKRGDLDRPGETEVDLEKPEERGGDLGRAESSRDWIWGSKEIFRTKGETMNAGGVGEWTQTTF